MDNLVALISILEFIKLVVEAKLVDAAIADFSSFFFGDYKSKRNVILSK
jgi:hypothetical protein